MIKPGILREEEEPFLPAGSFAVQAIKKCPEQTGYWFSSVSVEIY
jgi:hypothetical protein